MTTCLFLPKKSVKVRVLIYLKRYVSKPFKQCQDVNSDAYYQGRQTGLRDRPSKENTYILARVFYDIFSTYIIYFNGPSEPKRGQF